MRDKIKMGGIGVVSALIILSVPLFIKFFFRGILMIMNNPLESVGFFGLLFGVTLIYILLTEK
jgi:hypothetical protein